MYQTLEKCCPNCKIHIDYELLYELIYIGSELMDYFYEKGAIRINAEGKIRLIHDFLPMNTEHIVKTLIKIGAVSHDTWDEAVACAVEHNAFKALNILNEQYQLICKSHIN